MDISKELDWILSTLGKKEGCYLLEEVVDRGKLYSVADVHEWGSKAEYSTKYEKVKDLIKVRIHEAVEMQRLDKGLAGEILKTYYYKPFADAVPKDGDDFGSVTDAELEKRMNEMGWYRHPVAKKGRKKDEDNKE